MTRQTGATWPDFYNLLKVPDNAHEGQIRSAIARLHAAAVANWDNPAEERRSKARRVVRQMLPDCCAILLNKQRRSLYDWYLSYQHAGERILPDYQTFVGQLREVPEDEHSANEPPPPTVHEPRIHIDAEEHAAEKLREQGRSLLKASLQWLHEQNHPSRSILHPHHEENGDSS